jgi:hypothetical protein
VAYSLFQGRPSLSPGLNARVRAQMSIQPQSGSRWFELTRKGDAQTFRVGFSFDNAPGAALC